MPQVGQVKDAFKFGGKGFKFFYGRLYSNIYSMCVWSSKENGNVNVTYKFYILYNSEIKASSAS